MKNVTRLALVLFLIFHFCSCSEDSSQNAAQRDDVSPNQEEDSTNLKDGDSTDEDDSTVDDSDDSQPDDDSDDNNTGTTKDTEPEICNTIDLNLEAAPVRIMILQDLSSSMNEGTPSKWVQAQQALTSVLDTYNDSVDFGFDGFPNLVQCGVAQPPFSDCAADNGENIKSHLGDITLSISTPLYRAMQNFQNADYAPQFLSMGATRYLLIVSDGKDTCGVNGTFMGGMGGGVTATQLGDLTSSILDQMGVMTYVIGFGDGADPEQLNAIAAAGGTSATEYFNAQDQAELENALNQIVGISVSCVFDLGEQDENEIDLNQVNFYFDDEVVGLDDGCADGSGWNWLDDQKTKVEFCTKACEKIKNHEIKEISATFGCPTQVVDII